MHELASSFVLGYHGCRKSVARKIVEQQEGFRASTNSYDWLGQGIYFWLENPKRACEWARNQARRQGWERDGDGPAAIGAVIDLGTCLDLTTTAGIEMVQSGYEVLKIVISVTGEPMPANSRLYDGDRDILMRRLDCAVINTACNLAGKDKVDTVKGVFTEGGAAFAGSMIKLRTHTQIAVRNPGCIKGVFHVPARYLSGDADVCHNGG